MINDLINKNIQAWKGIQARDCRTRQLSWISDFEWFSFLPQEYSEANSQNVPKCWLCRPLYQERLLEETSSQAIIQGNLVEERGCLWYFPRRISQLFFTEKSPALSHREPKNGLDTDCERRLGCGWSQWSNKSIDYAGLQLSQGCQEKTTGCSNTPSCLRAFWLDSRAHTHPESYT